MVVKQKVRRKRISQSVRFLESVRRALSVKLPSQFVDELLAAYIEAKRNFYLGGHRLNAVEGGRFCEAAYRLLETQFKTPTPLGGEVHAPTLTKGLENLPKAQYSDSIRLHIPHALRTIYGIRSKRNTIHLNDGIDPNRQDATFLISTLDWVLAEFLRLFHSINADQAQDLIEQIVTRAVPAIQNFDGFLKVLNPKLEAGDCCLLLVYSADGKGATFDAIYQWVFPMMRPNLNRTLKRLTDDIAHLHLDEKSRRYLITKLGIRYVERKRLFEIDE